MRFEHLAAILDASATFTLYRTRTARQPLLYEPRILVVSADLRTLDAFAATFGGRVSRHTRTPSTARDLFQWRLCSAADVARVIDVCLPLLEQKRRHAELLLEFCARRSHAPYTARERTIHREIARLNKRRRRT